jgi:hypothetical protein
VCASSDGARALCHYFVMLSASRACVGEEMAGVADDLSHCVWEAGGACGPHAKRWGSRRERA